MPYTPPAGNAASVDFITVGYAPPAGNAASVDFGSSTGGFGGFYPRTIMFCAMFFVLQAITKFHFIDAGLTRLNWRI